MSQSQTFIPKSIIAVKPLQSLKLFLINAELSPLQIKSDGTYGELLSPRPPPQMTDALHKTPGVSQAVETSLRHLPINFVVLRLWMEIAARWFDAAADRWPIGDRGSTREPAHSGSCSSKRRHLQEMVWQMPEVVKVLPTPNNADEERWINPESHMSRRRGFQHSAPRWCCMAATHQHGRSEWDAAGGHLASLVCET